MKNNFIVKEVEYAIYIPSGHNWVVGLKTSEPFSLKKEPFDYRNQTSLDNLFIINSDKLTNVMEASNISAVYHKDYEKYLKEHKILVSQMETGQFQFEGFAENKKIVIVEKLRFNNK